MYLDEENEKVAWDDCFPLVYQIEIESDFQYEYVKEYPLWCINRVLSKKREED